MNHYLKEEEEKECELKRARKVNCTQSEVEDLHDDVVDGNVDELDEEADEAHDGKANGGGESDLLEL